MENFGEQTLAKENLYEFLATAKQMPACISRDGSMAMSIAKWPHIIMLEMDAPLGGMRM